MIFTTFPNVAFILTHRELDQQRTGTTDQRKRRPIACLMTGCSHL